MNLKAINIILNFLPTTVKIRLWTEEAMSHLEMPIDLTAGVPLSISQ
jgi:hypothetical protein